MFQNAYGRPYSDFPTAMCGSFLVKMNRCIICSSTLVIVLLGNQIDSPREHLHNSIFSLIWFKSHDDDGAKRMVTARDTSPDGRVENTQTDRVTIRLETSSLESSASSRCGHHRGCRHEAVHDMPRVNLTS